MIDRRHLGDVCSRIPVRIQDDAAKTDFYGHVQKQRGWNVSEPGRWATQLLGVHDGLRPGIRILNVIPRYSMARGAALLAVPVNMNVNSLQVIIKPILRGEKTWRGN
jgi:hypothetical protein